MKLYRIIIYVETIQEGVILIGIKNFLPNAIIIGNSQSEYTKIR